MRSIGLPGLGRRKRRRIWAINVCLITPCCQAVKRKLELRAEAASRSAPRPACIETHRIRSDAVEKLADGAMRLDRRRLQRLRLAGVQFEWLAELFA